MTFEQQLLRECKSPIFWAKVIVAFFVISVVVWFELAL